MEKQIRNLQKKVNKNNNNRPRRSNRIVQQPRGRRHQGMPLRRNNPTAASYSKDFMKEHSKESDYFRTLRDPFSYSGAKIPDMCTYPSATFSTITRLTVTPVLDGTGFFAGIACVGLQPNASVFEVTAKSGDVLTWTAFDSGVGDGNIPAWPAIEENYRMIRPVSAGLSLMSSSSSLNDSGIMVSSNLPGESKITGLGYYDPFEANQPWYSFTSLKNTFGSCVIPVNQKGICTCYRPSDPGCFDYVDVTAYNDGGGDQDMYNNYGNLAIVVSGISSSATFEVILQINFEAIPKSASLGMINVSASQSDPLDLAISMNKASRLPLGEKSTRKVERISTQALTNHAPIGKTQTFMEKVLSGIGKYGPAIGKAALALTAAL